MPESTFDHPLFGTIRFRTQSNIWVRGDPIVFLSGFDSDDITSMSIPQLKSIPGSHQGTLRFHRRGQVQLLKAFAEIETAGLLPHIKTCAGTLNRRLRKPLPSGISKLPSNHAFGVAIDLNSDDGSDGGSVAPVAPIFQRNGFRWGIEFNDPMHFEVASFMGQGQADAGAINLPDASTLPFMACRQAVLNRGEPPLSFLQELVAWGRTADRALFAPNVAFDIYSAMAPQLGPWNGPKHRRAAMLEALRVLGGFESSWNWQEGRDPDNSNPSQCAEEAGIFQCSGDSMALDPLLKHQLLRAGGDGSCASFITTTKADHAFATEYCARLLRVTTKHHGPVRFGQINAWLRRDAVEEFQRFLGA